MGSFAEDEVTDASREAYVRELYEKASTGQDESSFIELGQIAAGRSDFPLAKELFLKLDNKPQ